MQGLKCRDSNIQIPTSGLGQGGKVSLNAIVSSLLSPSASVVSLSLSQWLWLQDGDVSKDSRG